MKVRLDHFWDCHPDDDHAPRPPAGYVPQDIEPRWHCGTQTDMGCYCLNCAEANDVIPAGQVFHCKMCGRFWAYVNGLNIYTITF